jgi:hypothetical protein
MSEEVILAVLNEVLDELKEANRSLKQMDARVKELETGAGETASGLNKLRNVVAAQPKPVLYRLTLFPGDDWQGNYKTFIRWLIGGIVGAMLVASAYVLGNEWIQRTQPPSLGAGMEMKVPADTPGVARPAPVPGKRPSKHARNK